MNAIPGVLFPPLARFRFGLTALDPIRLPDYAGSAWRGLLGHGLRRTACVTRQPTCDGCLLRQSCVYSTLFETPGAEDDSYSAFPHPFVLDIDPSAPRRLAPGESYALTIHLIGAAIAQAPYLIHALGHAGQLGFGRERARFAVTGVTRENGLGTDDWEEVYTTRGGVYRTLETAAPTLPPSPPAVQVCFTTPLRIKRNGRFLGARDLGAADLIQALYRRLRTLARLQGRDPDRFDLYRAAELSQTLRLHPRDLRWHDWTRYSSRQDARMQFGGLLGEILLDGPALVELWPALWLGQWTHVGKGTAFGLGGYRIGSGTDIAVEDA